MVVEINNNVDISLKRLLDYVEGLFDIFLFSLRKLKKLLRNSSYNQLQENKDFVIIVFDIV